MTLHGPRVIVPHNIYNKNAPVLCWDVGTCVVGSVEEVNGEKEKEEEGEYNSRLYRRFDVSLRNAKVTSLVFLIIYMFAIIIFAMV